MTDLELRIENLERQLRRVMDELELLKLTASYGPSVDSVSSDITAELWTDDGVYDVPGLGRWAGREQLRGMLHQELHQTLVRNGCAHVISLPRITLQGDSAVGTCYSRLYQRSAVGMDVLRVSGNRWEFVRTPDGWRIKYRTVLAMDGSERPRELLGRSFRD